MGDKGRWRLVVGMRPWRHWTIKELLEGEGAADSGNSGVVRKNLGRRRRGELWLWLWLWGRGMLKLVVVVRGLLKELEKEFSAVNRRRGLASTAGHS